MIYFVKVPLVMRDWYIRYYVSFPNWKKESKSLISHMCYITVTLSLLQWTEQLRLLLSIVAIMRICGVVVMI